MKRAPGWAMAHEVGVDLVGGEEAGAGGGLVLLAHGGPDVGVDGVGVAEAVLDVGGGADGGSAGGGELLGAG